jgi:hypothetical protein
MVDGLENSNWISSSSEEEGSAAFGSLSVVMGRASTGVLGTLLPKRRAFTTCLGRVLGSEESQNKLSKMNEPRGCCS